MALPKSMLLIISGSVAAYKSLELIRLLRGRGVVVTAILTKGGAEFITPLAVSSLTGTKTYTDLFSLTDELEMGHIELSRSADMILVAPASADLIANMAAGTADTLATTALLATNKPVAIAPAMNHRMWHHAATQRNLAQLRADGITIIDPTEGDMACGEHGIGRMAEPTTILTLLETEPTAASKPLAGKRAIVTSGATQEPIDPVRFIGNHSFGKQGHAVAAALAAAGADVTLICGATSISAPVGVRVVNALTAEAMLTATEGALPADIFVGAAAIADWRVTHVASHKIKKHGKIPKMTLDFIPTPDVLAAVAAHKKRPALVIGFAAETENLKDYARTKLAAKKCDWIVGNSVSTGTFGADENEVLLLNGTSETQWPRMSKTAVATKLVQEIISHFSSPTSKRKIAS
ncbi:MAG: bifunctional phosphopantothenoylcysteine decarboxylase/phosphopantothenate synthase [Rhodospirillales bacterium 12-54-5]|nr:MAG: bifunctional phosphopantothenoylcysteine decarboxylase/phosphopantothenate synthase [Rhodospirillales bacterium 12-54-5]